MKEGEAKIKQAKDGISAAESQLEKVAAEVVALEKETSAARSNVEEVRAALSSAKSQGTVLSALMEQKTKGKILGIHGRLGDLGSIDGKYDVAISTACGALDNIVVSDAESAQKCVQFLREKNLGVATFLILDKQKFGSDALGKRTGTPGGVPRLYDLVRPVDEIFRSVSCPSGLCGAAVGTAHNIQLRGILRAAGAASNIQKRAQPVDQPVRWE